MEPNVPAGPPASEPNATPPGSLGDFITRPAAGEPLLPAAPPPRPTMPPGPRALMFIAAAAGVWFGSSAAALLVALLGTMAVTGSQDVMGIIKALERSPFFLAPMEVLLALAMLGLAALFWTYVDVRPWREFGLSFTPGWTRRAGLGIMLGAGPVLLASAFYLAVGHLRIHGWAPGTGERLLLMAATYVVFCIAVGFAEEIAFRGYLVPNLIAAAGRPAGILLSAVIFVLPHLGNPKGLTPLNILAWFLAGTAFALLFLGSGDLWAPVAMHAAFNLATFVLSPSTLLQPLLEVSVHGPVLVYGGPDRAGLLDVLWELAWLFVIWRWIYLPSLKARNS